MKFSELTTFTLEELNALLDGRSEDSIGEELKKPTEIATASQGPGHLNKWGLLEGNNNAWEKLQPTETKTRKRKVILSYPPELYAKPSLPYAFLRAGLIEHCDVFQWHSEPMSEQTPITTTKEGWKNHLNQKAASKSQIQSELAEQGLDINDYQIIDYVELQKLLFKLTSESERERLLNEDEIDEGYLDLDSIKKILTHDELLSFLKDGISFEKIKYIKLGSYNDISLIPQEHLPVLTIMINDITINRANDFLDLPIHGLYITNLDGENDDVMWEVITDSTKLKSIKVSGGNIQLIDLEKSKSIETIKLEFLDSLLRLELPNVKSLDELTLIDCPLLDAISHTISEIGKFYFTGCHANLRFINDDPPNISNYLFTDRNNTNLKLGNNLKTLDICETELVDLIDHENQDLFLKVENFTSLDIKDAQAYLSRMPKLVNVTIQNTESEIIDLRNCKNLRSLTLQNLPKVKHIILPQGIYLDNLNITEINPYAMFNYNNVLTKKYTCKGKITTNEKSIAKHARQINQPSVQSLFLEITGLDSFNLANFSNVEEFSITGNHKDLLLPRSNKLKKITVDLENNEFDSLILEEYPQLESIKVFCSTIDEIRFSKEAPLKNIHLEIDGCKLVNLNSDHLERANINLINEEIFDSIKSEKLRQLDIKEVVGNIFIEANEFLPNLASIKLNIEDIGLDLSNCEKLKHATYHFDNIADDERAAYYNEIYFRTPGSAETMQLMGDADQQLSQNTLEKLDYYDAYHDIRIFDIQNINHPFKFDKKLFPNLLSNNVSENELEEDTPVRTVSRYKLNGQLDIDSNTNDLQNHEANGELYSELISYKQVNINHQRTSYADRFYYDQNNQLIPCQIDLNNLTYHDLNHKIKPFDPLAIDAIEKIIKRKNAPEILGHFHGIVNPNTIYLLPQNCDCDIADYNDFFIEAAENIKEYITIVWVEELKQSALIYNPPEMLQDNIEVDIFYHFKENVNYRDAELLDSNLNFVRAENRTYLPTPLYRLLQELIKNNEELSYLFDKNLSTADLIKFIFTYCENFENEDLDAADQNDKTQNLLNIINEKKGACRHRSFAAMALLHFFGIKARIVYNEAHAFVEVAYLDDRKEKLLCLDMGGAPMNDLTDEADFDFLKSIPEPTPIISIPVLDKTTIAQQNKYKILFDKYAKDSEITDLSPLYNKSKLAPLIWMKNDTQALNVDALISHDIYQNHKDTTYLYIDTPKELTQFYNSAYYDETGKKLNRLKGELATAINKKSVIVINLSTFSAAEIAAFKSCVDTERKLFGMPIGEDVKVILTLTDETPACAALYSRCKKFSLSENLQAPNIDIAVDYMQVEGLELDFFNRPFWNEILYGSIKFQGDKIQIDESLLIKAMREGLPITLYNVPENKELERIIKRIQMHRQIFYNGKFVNAAQGFALKISEREHDLSTTNIDIFKTSPSNKYKIVIGLHNLDALYSQLHITPPKGHDKEGFLASYNPDTQVLYFVDSVPTDELAYLIHVINTQYPNKKFHFCLAPKVSLGNQIGESGQSDQRKDAIYTSNDPVFLATKLARQITPIPVNHLTTFSDLIYSINVATDNKISFELNTKDVLNALQHNQEIVLVGDISQQLASELQTLLENNPYYIDAQNNRINVNSKLTLVLTSDHKLNIEKTININFTLDDYPWSDSDKPFVNQIKQFYELANQALGQRLPISYHLIKAMIERLKSPILHPHNPIKGLMLYNYPKDSDQYALLNIIAKYVFTPKQTVPINRERLSKLINKLKDKTTGEIDVDRYYFRILNCFGGKALHHIIGNNINSLFSPDLRLDISSKLNAEINEFYIEKPEDKPHKNPIDQLFKLIDSDIPLIILKGPPGVGKSYTVRQLKNMKNDISISEGINNIEEWLKAASLGQTKILLLDEANMALPGTWDFLKGLSLDKKCILYQGKLYQLSDQHKIIAAVNPDDYPGRHQHSYFQHHGETLYFKASDKYFLEKTIIRNILVANDFEPSTAEMFYQAYELYIQHQPFRAISIRDLEALTSRVCVLAQLGIPPVQAFYNACINEYTYAISNIEQRKQFINSIETLLNNKILPFTPLSNQITLERYSENFYLPSTKLQIANIIEEDILLCDFAAKNPHNSLNFKRGILLEGDSGIGKSTLYLKILIKLGYSDNHHHPQKRFYHFSALDPDAADKLLKAFHEGAKVVLDELDLNPVLENLLNQYLSGVDLNGKPADNPGFMLLASQNGARFVGRTSTPYALANRFHFINMDPLSNSELNVIAGRIVEDPENFAAAYREEQLAHPGTINMRTFYTVLSDLEFGRKRKHEKDTSDYDASPLFKRPRTEQPSSNPPDPNKPSQ